MPFTAITTGINTEPKLYATPPANVLNGLVFQAMDNTNGNSFKPQNRTTLFIKNTDTVTHTFTIVGVPDAFGATPTIGPITVAANTGNNIAVVGPFSSSGPYVQSDGTVQVSCNSALLFIATLEEAQ